jgi:hypothetical protein
MCDRCIRWGGRTWHMWRRGYYETNIRLHREVWSSLHGEIPPGYDVHHVNEDRSDNRPENLVLLSKAEHSSLHAEAHLGPHRTRALVAARAAIRKAIDERKRTRVLTCVWCGSEYRSGAIDPTSYCSTKCIDAARSGRFEGDARICARCGTPFAATRRVQVYCSKQCNTKASADRSASRIERELSCAQCGNAFRSSRSNARFCSRACGLLFHGGHRFRRKIGRAA